MEQGYWINIAFKSETREGKYFHWARMYVGMDQHIAKLRLNTMREKFPEPEFKVKCTHWTSVGTEFMDEEQVPTG